MNFLNLRTTIAKWICPELEKDRRAFERAANIDGLTGIANRRAFDAATATADNTPGVCFILFDANDFGKLNKVAGHQTGDLVLQDIAGAIKAAAAAYGFGERVFRLGGDEFAVIADCKRAEQIRDLAEKEFGTVSVCGVSVSVSGTIGETIEKADRFLQMRKKMQKTGKLTITGIVPA